MHDSDSLKGSPNKLESISRRIRKQVLEVAGTEGGGHLGGTFSCVEILVSLFMDESFHFGFMNQMSEDRDRFILSKGHACLAYYSFLHERGLISNELLHSFAKNGGLGAQLSLDGPFVDWHTGSLGHSIGISAGIALGARLGSRNFRAITVIGDSELSEGSSWEAIAFCSDHNLSNVIVVIDRNRLSVTSAIEEDAIYRDLEAKIRSFGWNYLSVDGHSYDSLKNGYNQAKISNRPTMILAQTVKGKGVSFMENKTDWHHKKPSLKEFESALNELSAKNELN